jgi:hypothetical protein
MPAYAQPSLAWLSFMKYVIKTVAWIVLVEGLLR